MGFYTKARRVRNPNLPPIIRRSSLRSCLLSLAQWTGEKFGEIVDRFDSRFGFNAHRVPSEDSLLRAIDAVEVERNGYVERLRAFEKKRIKAKARGKRQMTKQEQRDAGQLGRGPLAWCRGNLVEQKSEVAGS
jgi:hypothetical protein